MVGTRVHMAHKLQRIFPTPHAHMRYDYEGLYSITPLRESILMAEILADACWQVLGLGASSVRMIDGTAGIGGNTIGFSRFFRCVLSIEIDAKRFKLLQHNLVHAAKLPNVICFRADVLKLRTAHAPVLFLDPPWGGCAYRQAKQLPLFLGKKPLHDVIQGFYQHQRRPHPMLVGLKVPVNFGMERFTQAIAPITVYSKHRLAKMVLVVLVMP